MPITRSPISTRSRSLRTRSEERTTSSRRNQDESHQTIYQGEDQLLAEPQGMSLPFRTQTQLNQLQRTLATTNLQQAQRNQNAIQTSSVPSTSNSELINLQPNQLTLTQPHPTQNQLTPSVPVPYTSSSEQLNLQQTLLSLTQPPQLQNQLPHSVPYSSNSEPINLQQSSFGLMQPPPAQHQLTNPSLNGSSSNNNFATFSNTHVSTEPYLPGQLSNIPCANPIYQSQHRNLPNFQHENTNLPNLTQPINSNREEPSQLFQRTHQQQTHRSTFHTENHTTPNLTQSSSSNVREQSQPTHQQQSQYSTLRNESHSYNHANLHHPGVSIPVQSPMTTWSNSFSNLNFQIEQLRNPSQTFSQPKKLYDLPEFDGTPELWQIFISQFLETTKEYQYSNLQNTMRLTKALKGKARDHVQSLLVNPNNVDLVLQQLEFLYGRPEMLLDSQIRTIQKVEKIPENNLELLIPLSIKIQNLTAFLQTMPNPQIHLCNPSLLNEIISKLPFSKRDQWIRHALNIRPYYTMKDLSSWISQEAQYISLIGMTNYEASTSKTRVLAITSNRQSLGNQNTNSNRSNLGNQNVNLNKSNLSNHNSNMVCPSCNQESHLLIRCPEFRKLSVQKRWDKVKLLNVCFSCLRPGHITENCSIKRQCNIENCESFHNRYLHRNYTGDNAVCNNINEPYQNQDNVVSDGNDNESHSIHCINSKSTILYKILPVKLYGEKGSQDVLAFIDEGSNVTLIDNELMISLGFNKHHSRQTNMTIKWFGETTVTETSSIVSLKISGINDKDQIYRIDDVRTTSNLDLPSQCFNSSTLSDTYNEFRSISLSYPSKKPKILIGLDNSSLCYPRNSIETAGLFAIETKLGWTIYGKANPCILSCNIAEVLTENEDITLHQIIEDHINCDNIGLTYEESISIETQRALDILQTTTKHLEKESRYETGLLWASEDIKLPNNFQTAFNRLLYIEKRMKNDTNFADKYEKNLMSYVEKKYARKLSYEETKLYPGRQWYLPHFVSLNPNKPEKFRIVFDAASKHEGVSLNSALLSGPDLNQPMFTILLNFRIGKYGVCGDIQEMFSQIKIIEKDQHSQRFLWRHGDPKRTLETYVMTSMTFGATCSPCSAQYIKNENARQFQDIDPSASNAIQNFHYVDDFVMSFITEEEALRVTLNVKKIHAKGGFHLRKFVSNSEKIIKGLGLESTDSLPLTMNKTMKTSEKILGLHWDYISDSFIFKIQMNRIDESLLQKQRHPTKREVLKIVMSIFDPLGFLNNFVMQGRLILQEIWKSSVGWDDKIPDNVYCVWRKWIGELPELNLIKIPRPYFKNQANYIELHTFTDAGESAFAAVSYLRTVAENGSILVSFLMSKSKLAPLKKKHSIPRLELQGAVLGAKLKLFITENLKMNINKFYFWSDSKVVLYWINSNSERYKPFVSHRIAAIQNLSKAEEWNWVSSKENVADEATKFAKKSKEYWQGNWFIGPNFLHSDNEQWKLGLKADTDVCMNLEESEVKPKLLVNTIFAEENLIDLGRFSSFWKLKRVVAWIFRAKDKFRTKEICVSLPLSVCELQNAEIFLLKLAQRKEFAQEISCIESNQPLHKNSSINPLCPFIDDKGLIRVSGRLQEAWYLPYKRQKPIILPKKHIVTKLIVKEFHEDNMHVFTQGTINNIRAHYWIPSVRQVLRSIEHQCIKCKLLKAQHIQPLMGNLPVERLMPYTRPFSYCGIDFCGPFNIKNGKKIGKCWILVVTCMTIRAIHLEVVEKLNTENTLLKLGDFINRRGLPVKIRSDCASYFKSAKKRLHEILGSPEIVDGMAKRNIQWVHNCPGTPHLGGAWERLIRCVKRVLEFSLKEVTPTIDIFKSFVINAENLVNNRPLTEESLNINDEEPITPNHFLLGSTNNWQTIGCVKIVNVRKQLNLLKSMKQRFWKKWVNEFSQCLNKRPKWTEDNKSPISINDLVLVEQQGKWEKGIITKICSNKDKKVRFLEIRTKNGVIKKHATNILFPNLEARGEC